MGFTKYSANAQTITCDCINHKNIAVSGKSIYQTDSPSPQNPSRIRGVGDKTVNLIPYPYVSAVKEANGITYTDNGDGTISASGSATADSSYKFLAVVAVDLPPGKYFFSGCPFGGASTTYTINYAASYSGNGWDIIDATDYGRGLSFTASQGIKYLYGKIIIRKGASANNLVFKPQLEIGSSKTNFVPYGEQKCRIPITSSGKNIFDADQLLKASGWTKSEDGVYSGEVNKLWSKFTGMGYDIPLRGKKLAISFEARNAKLNSITTYFQLLDFYGSRQNIGVVSTTEWKKYSGISNFSTVAKISPGYNTNDIIHIRNIQIEEATECTEYEPFTLLDTKDIVLSHPLYGKDNIFDSVNFKKQHRSENCFYKELTGEEKWEKNDMYVNAYQLPGLLPSTPKAAANCYCSHFRSLDSKELALDREEKLNGISWRSFNALFFNSSCDTVAEFKAFLKKQASIGNPVTILIIEDGYVLPQEKKQDCPAIPTTEGDTTIFIGTNTSPANVDISFYQYQNENEGE